MPETIESLPRICTADSTCQSLLFFTQLFLEFAQAQPAKPVRKQNLTQKSQSRSFKVMHFGITEKPMTDCTSPYNNTGLISKVSEKIAIKVDENCHFRQPHCRLGNSANIRISLIPPGTRVIGLHFCCWQYGSIFIRIFAVGSERRIFSATECVVTGR